MEKLDELDLKEQIMRRVAPLIMDKIETCLRFGGWELSDTGVELIDDIGKVLAKIIIDHGFQFVDIVPYLNEITQRVKYYGVSREQWSVLFGLSAVSVASQLDEARVSKINALEAEKHLASVSENLGKDVELCIEQNPEGSSPE